MSPEALTDNVLYYGDNLDVLRKRIKDESIDLVYLDPPFNSNRSYNVLFGHKTGEDAQAQIEAFDDTWTWSQEADGQYRELIGGGAPGKVADAIEGLRKLLGETDMLAYLVMMTPRLLELHRVMKPIGSLYLHCDPTASHYLKLILDAIFDPRNFRNEISWKRFSAKNDPNRYGRNHDVLLFYTKTAQFTWNDQYGAFESDYVEENYRYIEEGTGRRYRLSDLTAHKPGGDVDYEWHGMRPYKGRHWAFSKTNMDKMLSEGRIVFRRTGMPVFKRYLDEMPGVPLQDIWTDIRLHAGSKERLGYPTQKPVDLLKRIITSSSNRGDVVLDPFCGCGTTIEAAHELGRTWIGIDVTYIAVDLIQKRMRHRFGDAITDTFDIDGIPRDVAGAHALFTRSPFDFERWAVSLVDGTPNERQVGDKGIDGVVRFPLDNKGAIGRALVSVKGGGLNPAMVRDLIGTVETQRADMGILISLERPTRGIDDAIRHSGTYTFPVSGRNYPRTQLLTVEQLLAGKKPDMPTPLLPYIKAQRASLEKQLTLGEATYDQEEPRLAKVAEEPGDYRPD